MLARAANQADTGDLWPHQCPLYQTGQILLAGTASPELGTPELDAMSRPGTPNTHPSHPISAIGSELSGLALATDPETLTLHIPCEIRSIFPASESCWLRIKGPTTGFFESQGVIHSLVHSLTKTLRSH